MELAKLSQVSQRTNELLKLYAHRDELRTPAIIEARDTMQAAVKETHAYFLTIQKEPTKRNVAEEHAISLLWLKAAEKIHPIDPELGQYCQEIGSTPWTNPGSWTYQQLHQALTLLENLEKSQQHLQPAGNTAGGHLKPTPIHHNHSNWH